MSVIMVCVAVFALLIYVGVVQNPFRTAVVPVPLNEQEFIESVSESYVSKESEVAKKQFIHDAAESPHSTSEQRASRQQQKQQFMDSFRQTNR